MFSGDSVSGRKRGRGLINTLIDKLPFEAHLRHHNFCGPGTRLKLRLQRGDKGINELDEACKEHDIAYDQNKDLKSRHIADKILAEKAKSRILSKGASFGERVGAAGVYAAMSIKRKIGAGIRKKSKMARKKRGRGFILPVISAISAGVTAIRAIKDMMKASKTLKEKQGSGLYLKPYKKSGKGFRKKRGSGLKKKKLKKRKKKNYFLQ